MATCMYVWVIGWREYQKTSDIKPTLSHNCRLQPCADPESFVRGGPNLITFFVEGWNKGSKYRFNWVIIDQSAKRHLNGVSLAGRWWSNIECWLGSFVIFQGIRTSIAKKPYIFVIFRGSSHSRPPAPPPPPLWIRL